MRKANAYKLKIEIIRTNNNLQMAFDMVYGEPRAIDELQYSLRCGSYGFAVTSNNKLLN